MDKKTIFITGAGQGIGRETAKKFAREGWFVGAYDVKTEGIDSLLAELGEASVIGGHLDVTDYAEFQERLREFGAATDGKLNVIFNNAGILEMGRFEDISIEMHHRTIDVNVKGVVNGMYASLDMLKATPGSCILSMCSASGVYGAPDHSVYGATKFAVRALTEVLDVELEKHGIKVCDIMPAFVGTNMVLGQENPSPMVERVGIPHQPEEIAEHAWEMVHGTKIHWMTRQVRFLDFMVGLMPGFVRGQMKKAMETL